MFMMSVLGFHYCTQSSQLNYARSYKMSDRVAEMAD